MSDETVKPKRWCCDGNAEDCALCDTGKLPYPWICPGDHEDVPANRGLVLKAAVATGNRDTIKAMMRRFRRYDQAVAEVASGLCEEPHETIEAEDACEARRLAARSAVQAWAEEPDLGEALGSFGDGYRHAQRDAQAALALDELVAREGSEGVETADADLNAAELRTYVSKRLLAIATERVTREWICCDPVNDQHDLCVDGRNTITMLRSLLTDDETVFPPRSDFLDEVMRLVFGHADPTHRNNVLSTAEVREIYGKAVTRGLQTVVDWDGMDDLKPLKANVIHAITAEVIAVRDRELARNRQRLLLANERHLDAVGALGAADAAHQDEVASAVAAARLEERLTVLNEVNVKLMGECSSPFEQLAYHNVFLWLKRQRAETQRGLDTRSDG